jgi:hypothetical protein
MQTTITSLLCLASASYPLLPCLFFSITYHTYTPLSKYVRIRFTRRRRRRVAERIGFQHQATCAFFFFFFLFFF